MFDKLQKWFKSQPKTNTTDSTEAAATTDTATVRAPMDKQESAPNSEFVIKYNRNKGSMPRLNPIGRDLFLTDPKSDTNKVDTNAYIIHCAKHDTVAVYEDPNSGIRWLPFTPTCPDKSWSESAKLGVLLVLSNSEEQYFALKQNHPFNSVQLLEILRIQLPQTLNFLTRMIFYVKLIPDCDNYSCCSPGNSIAWFALKELCDGTVHNIWGPEMVQFTRVVASNFEEFGERIEEFSLDDVYLYSPRDPPRNAEETMLLELNISEKTIEILYNDFLEHCYPCFSLPVHSFKMYLSKYGFKPDDDRLNSLFLAFNYKKSGYVSFHELLMGLVALEPQASHQETRIKFIFRFYDMGSKGYLDLVDFAKCVGDMYSNLEGDELQAKQEECAEAVEFTVKDGQKCVTFSKFMEAIASLRLRGTSKLCRSSVPVFLQLTRAFIRRKKPTSDDLKEWKDLKSVLIPRVYKGDCKRCMGRRYKLATHAVTINGNGYPGSPIRIVSKDSRAAPLDRHSVDFIWSSKSISNVLLGMIRQFAKHKGNLKAPRGLLDGPKERNKMYDLLVKLVEEAKPILKKENRLPNVSSPCYVIGDIHGNIEDLLTMEKVLWRSAPVFGPGFLFLGDYVDRGKWGFECAVYLLSLKLLDPTKVTLLRGNHEVRALQEKYSYKKECLTKYGTEFGERIWALTNELFDLLPVAATIDDKIFCCHGGLSPNAPTLDHIRKLPCPLANPEQQARVAWDILWSDPCHMQQYLDTMEWIDLTANEFAQNGYIYNTKRGASYLFNERAASCFLSKNGLSHMIRAHEVPAFGFTHHFTNMCTTVFSCSHYCNYDNECAVILVDSNRIRAIRIDTHNNAPATDK